LSVGFVHQYATIFLGFGFGFGFTDELRVIEPRIQRANEC
jgi:hypothetical protein